MYPENVYIIRVSLSIYFHRSCCSTYHLQLWHSSLFFCLYCFTCCFNRVYIVTDLYILTFMSRFRCLLFQNVWFKPLTNLVVFIICFLISQSSFPCETKRLITGSLRINFSITLENLVGRLGSGKSRLLSGLVTRTETILLLNPQYRFTSEAWFNMN